MQLIVAPQHGSEVPWRTVLMLEVLYGGTAAFARTYSVHYIETQYYPFMVAGFVALLMT